MKRQTLQLQNFIDWLNSEKVMYARDSKTDRRMDVSLTGVITVIARGQVVYYGRKPNEAIEAYNEA